MDNKDLKVFFLPAWYPNPDNRIGGIFIKEHAKALVNKVKLLVVFYVFPYRNSKKLIEIHQYQEEGIRHYIIYHKRFKGVLFILNYFLYAYCLFVGYFKVLKLYGKPDINHVHVLTRVGLPAMLIKFIYKVPYVITEHWSRYLLNSDQYRGAIRKWMTKKIINYSDGLSTVSDNLRFAMKKRGLHHSNSPVIYNTVDVNSFYKIFSEQSNKKIKFLHVSGIEDNVKNVSGILEAVVLLRQKIRNFELHIIGDHADRRKYEDDVKLKGLDNVFFYGELYGSDLIKHYQNSDVFVLFSNYENLPCVLLEALCCGLPLIASGVGGVSEIVNENNGILVKSKDITGLSEAMEYMVNNLKMFDTSKIIADARNKYAYPSVSEEFLAFYNKALDNYLIK